MLVSWQLLRGSSTVLALRVEPGILDGSACTQGIRWKGEGVMYVCSFDYVWHPLLRRWNYAIIEKNTPLN